MRKSAFISLLLWLLTVTAAVANPAAPEPAADDLLSTLKLQKGTVNLPNDVAALEVPEAFRYIGPEDTKKFLEEGWGNQDGSGSLGMLLPAGVELFGPEGWGVVITYQEDGYVSDEDAGKIDYKDLLESMQEGEEEENEERTKAGYDPVSLVGWAKPPFYDAQAKKLYWAKELKFGTQEENTLNYNVRILGRKGVLVMNAISGIGQLPQVEEHMKQVIAFTDFTKGNRYSDFDPGVDKVAAYGIAALIGGTIAAKAGLFAKLGVLLFAFKKIIIVAVVAIGAFLAKFFKRRKIIADPPVVPAPPEV